MKWRLLFLAERLTRDAALRARIQAAQDALDGTGTPSLGAIPQEEMPRGAGDVDQRARSFVWAVGAGLIVLWALLIGIAYSLWTTYGDWAILKAMDIGWKVGLPADAVGPVSSILTTVGDLVTPALTVIGIATAVAILIVTSMDARLLGRQLQ